MIIGAQEETQILIPVKEERTHMAVRARLEEFANLID